MVLVRIKLKADASPLQIEPAQHFDHALGGRLLRGLLRIEGDLAQRLAGLRAAGEFSRFGEGCDQSLVETTAPRELHDPPQAFARHQHEVVKGLVDGAADPGLDRGGIGRVVNGEHRALHDIGTLLRQKL